VVLTALCMAATVKEREQAEAAQQRAMVGLELRVLERTAALTRSESQARQHLAEAERARAALLSILEDERATEEALRASEGRFRTIFEQAPLGIAEGEITTARFVSVNKRCADILGYAIDELRELTFKDYTHPEDLHKELVEFDKLARGEIKTYEMEKRYIRKDGAIIWVNLTVSALAQTGEMPLNCIAVIDDITARKLAEQKVAESSEQLRALLKRLQQAQEDERIRVAREIHDELGQLLTGLKMDVRWLERKLADPSLPPALNPLLDRAVAASDMADQTIAVVQKIAAELRPGALDRLGLAAALTQKARRFQERTGIRCQVAVEESETALSAEIATELFYICQEALTNVARHAHATEVHIRFEMNENGLVLEVRDNGGGMTEADFLAPHSLGLLGMRERASHCAGRVVWERCVPQGTRVTVHIPYDGAVTKQGEPL
jgi:PAS domain S-box-containing protein